MKGVTTVAYARRATDEIAWDTESLKPFPSLAEINEAAEKEFPGIPASELEVSAEGYDAEVVVLKQKN